VRVGAGGRDEVAMPDHFANSRPGDTRGVRRPGGSEGLGHPKSARSTLQFAGSLCAGFPADR
jgi:hypothetical protein